MSESKSLQITPESLIKMKNSGNKITMLTAYDYFFGRLIDEAGCDLILVGDSLGSVMFGMPTTIPVTMEEMLHHVRAVSNGVKRSMVIGDMPFMSYQVSKEEAIRNAGRLIKDGGARAVKLEGGTEMADTVNFMSERGILVMGHIGLMPQRVYHMGGYKTQGKNDDSKKRIMADALAIAQAGAFAIVLEGIPEALAREITAAVNIPTIGISAGKYCDGQVLVIYDLLNMSHTPLPKFVKVFADAGNLIKKGVNDYLSEVKNKKFPE